jgi:hypothetical protein
MPDKMASPGRLETTMGLQLASRFSPFRARLAGDLPFRCRNLSCGIMETETILRQDLGKTGRAIAQLAKSRVTYLN